MAAEELKEFAIVNGELYFWGGGGVLARALSKAEAKEVLQRIHDLSCGDNDISLYRRCKDMVMIGPIWPKKLLAYKWIARSAKNPSM